MRLVKHPSGLYANIEPNPSGGSPALLVICDSPSAVAVREGRAITPKQRELLLDKLGEAGRYGVVWIVPTGSKPDTLGKSEKQQREFFEPWMAPFREFVANFAPHSKVGVSLGGAATRVLAGRSVKITEHRGKFATYQATGDLAIMPVQSPQQILIVPELEPIFTSDLAQVATFARDGWDTVSALAKDKVDYQWCLDLEPWLDSPPESITLDTETKALQWWGRRAILTVQISEHEGTGVAVPVDLAYWNDETLRGETSRHLPRLTQAKVTRLWKQLRQLLGLKSLRVTGHNLKFDLHHLRQYEVEVPGWTHDTMQLIHLVDENMRSKSLDEGVRRWVPKMAGYADVFNANPIHRQKSRMDLVPHDDMLNYGCGDVDACLRLCAALLKEARKDPRSYRVYSEIKMPALKYVFLNHAERFGLPVDRGTLQRLTDSLTARRDAGERQIITEAGARFPALMARHQEAGWKMSRPNFVRDMLFSSDGLLLTPILYTKGSKDADPEDKIPSTSVKEHLPYFSHIPLVAQIIEHQRLSALVKAFVGRPQTEEWVLVNPMSNGNYRSSVVKAFASAGLKCPVRAMPAGARRTFNPPPHPEPGTEFETEDGVEYGTRGTLVYMREVEEAKGIWQYLTDGDPEAIHPSFGLHTAVTGRTNCRAPNLQNLPKHGNEAKQFRKMFKARAGFRLVEVDLSQAELRVAAAESMDPVMLRIYREGGDIHKLTAMRVSGRTKAQWESLSEEKQDELRRLAKAVNFGFLYGMWWTRFAMYARTTYGVTITDAQARAAREAYFALYPSLDGWHRKRKQQANRDGQVRSLHGYVRHLPGIRSVEEAARKEAERQAVNSPIQGLASDIALSGAVRYCKGADTNVARLLGFVHDAVYLEVKDGHEETEAAKLKWCMENLAWDNLLLKPLPVAIVADISIDSDRTLSGMTKRPDIKALKPEWV